MLLYVFIDYYREISVPAVSKVDGSPVKGKSADQGETKTVKHVLNYVPMQTAFEADASQLNKRSWQRIKAHFVMMKSKIYNRIDK